MSSLTFLLLFGSPIYAADGPAVEATITWQSDGTTKPDVGAVVILLPEGLKHPIPASDVSTLDDIGAGTLSPVEEQKYRILTETADGYGRAIFEDVPAGNYLALIISNSRRASNDAATETDLHQLRQTVGQEVLASLEKETLEHHDFITESLKVAPGITSHLDHDFGDPNPLFEWFGDNLLQFMTLVVIAGTALVALRQMKHARCANQLNALTAMRETLQSAEFRTAGNFVLHGLQARFEEKRAEFNKDTNNAVWDEIRLVANFFENVGSFARNGLIETRSVVVLWAVPITMYFRALERFIVLARTLGRASLWEDFEWLAERSAKYLADYPNGAHSKTVGRLAKDCSLIDHSDPHLRVPAPIVDVAQAKP